MSLAASKARSARDSSLWRLGATSCLPTSRCSVGCSISSTPSVKKARMSLSERVQRALEEQQKIEGEKHKAQQAIERAKGEGSAILFRAEKEAEANRKLAASLTPDLVRYAMVQKLSDKIQVMMLPSGQNFILDSDILRGTPREKR